jgi:G3E family GTPase
LSAPLPVTVVTGSLGVGKTTLISQLLAAKPHDENWVVLLNEFTEAGIDALTVASAARGRYDVRLVAGGCLCCTGEQDFRRNLRQVIDSGDADRLIVEPSGAGHPAGMIEELLAHEARELLRVEVVLGLIDPARVASGAAVAPGLARDQLDSADVIVLAKPDLADDTTWPALQQIVSSLYPPRSAIAAATLHDPLLSRSLTRLQRAANVAGPRTAASGDVRHALHASAALQSDAAISQSVVRLAGQSACSWIFPRGSMFSPQRLQDLMRQEATQARAAVRVKGVFQVSEDCWLLIQHSASGGSAHPSSWRRDSRVEVLAEGGTDWLRWGSLWRACQGAD